MRILCAFILIVTVAQNIVRADEKPISRSSLLVISREPVASNMARADEKPSLVLDTGANTAFVSNILFSKDAKTLLSIAYNTIRFSDVASGKTFRVLHAPLDLNSSWGPLTAALSPDGTTLAIGGLKGGSTRGAIRLLSFPQGTIERVLESEPLGMITALAFSADGKKLVSAGFERNENENNTTANEVQIWNVREGSVEHVLKGDDGSIFSVKFSPDGRFCAAACQNQSTVIWDAVTGRRLATLEGRVNCLDWSTDGLILATGNTDHSVVLWEVKSLGIGPGGPQKLRSFDKLGETGISSVTFTRDSKSLMCTSRLGQAPVAYVIEVKSGRPLVQFDRHSYSPLIGALSSDGSLAATAGYDEVRVWKTSDGTELHKLTGRGGVPYAAAWSVDGASIAWGNKFVAAGTNALSPLEFTFDLTSLELGSALDDRFVRTSFERIDLKLLAGPIGKSGYASEVLVKQGANVLTTLQGLGEEGTGEVIQCFTMLRGNRVALASSSSLRIYDALEGSSRACLYSMSSSILPGRVSSVSSSPDGRYLLSASHDRTLHIWYPDIERKGRTPRAALDPVTIEKLEKDPELNEALDSPYGLERIREAIQNGAGSKDVLEQFDVFFWGPIEPLLSCFFSGNDWVVWTPEGYYAASPGGEQMIEWKVDNGREKFASLYPASKFRQSLYRPDVIKLLLKTGSVSKALELADRQRGKTGSLTNVAEVLPPKIEIVGPSLKERVLAKSPLKVDALGQSVGSHPITAMRLFLDGRPHEGASGRIKVSEPRLGEIKQSWNVKLTPGKYQISVQAESEVSSAVSEPIEVTIAADRGLDIGGSLDQSKENVVLPSLYVLAIGVSDYPGKLKLNYAARDAQVLAKTLETSSNALYRKVEVKLLTDKQATRRDILKGLTWLRTQMTQNDVAIVMFAGHGAKDSDGTFYLLPVDVDTDDLLSTGVPGDQIKNTLAAVPGKVIVLLDACHAGAVDGKQQRAATALTDDLVRDLVTDDFGVIVMCSAMAREFALESQSIKHGFFTLAIVEGLSGKADQNKDGVVYFHELDNFTTERVKELAEGKQHPVTAKPTSIRSFPVSQPSVGQR